MDYFLRAPPPFGLLCIRSKYEVLRVSYFTNQIMIFFVLTLQKLPPLTHGETSQVRERGTSLLRKHVAAVSKRAAYFLSCGPCVMQTMKRLIFKALLQTTMLQNPETSEQKSGLKWKRKDSCQGSQSNAGDPKKKITLNLLELMRQYLNPFHCSEKHTLWDVPQPMYCNLCRGKSQIMQLVRQRPM